MMQSEKAPDFKQLFEAMPGNVFVIAADPPRFTIVAATEKSVREHKLKRDTMIGRPLFEAFPDNDPNQTSVRNTTASIMRVIEQGISDTMAVQRHDLKRPDSQGGGFEEQYWSVIHLPVFDTHGQVVYIIHRVEEVTELIKLKNEGAEHQALADALRTRTGEMEFEIYKRAQDIQNANNRLQEVNKKLSELDKAKTAFFSNISHEFRTPLTLLLSPLTDELEEQNDPLPPARLERIEIAYRNSLRLLKLVNSLLDFARLEAGRMQAVFEPTNLSLLTAELASNFRSACERAGLSLTVDCRPLPEPVYVDREMWEKVVLNLVSNAIKFTLQGEIAVNLKPVNDAVELTVRDTGIGIPADELPHLFERFYRVKTTAGRTQEGTGIGLALVKELVNLHGGGIDVASVPGKGSVFTVTIPRGSAHLPAGQIGAQRAMNPATLGIVPYVEEAMRWLPGGRTLPVRETYNKLPSEDEHAFTANPISSERAELKRPRVVWADDNADMREYVQRLLANAYEVEAVTDGREALEAVHRQTPDLVLADVMMPRLDGFGLLHALRIDESTRTLPIILLSARAGEEARIEGLKAGADNYLVKPFSARELLAVIAAQIEISRMRRKAEELRRGAEKAEVLRQTNNELRREVRQREQAENALRESEKELKILNENLESIVIQRTEQARALSTALTLAEQRERKRFSNTLHENLQQKILGALLLFKQARMDHQKGEQNDWENDVGYGIAVLEKAVQTAKALSIELNPPVLSTEGLDAALRWLEKHMRRNHGLEIELAITGPVHNIRNETQIMLTQMVRELLNNVNKYAGVTKARVEVSCIDKQIQIMVHDEGRGFEPRQVLTGNVDESRLGLFSIRERLRLFGGDLDIQSAPKQGTRVTITVPSDNC